MWYVRVPCVVFVCELVIRLGRDLTKVSIPTPVPAPSEMNAAVATDDLHSTQRHDDFAPLLVANAEAFFLSPSVTRATTSHAIPTLRV